MLPPQGGARTNGHSDIVKLTRCHGAVRSCHVPERRPEPLGPGDDARRARGHAEPRIPSEHVADLGLPVDVPSTALFTDQYELTMLQAALAAGTADRRSVFEVFTRRLPEGRRYGVVAGTGRVLDAVENFRFDADVLGFLRERGHRRRADLRVAGLVPLQRRHLGLPGGRGLLPGLADHAGRGHLRRVRAAGDRDPLDPQPRLGGRRRRLPDGLGRRRTGR